MKQSNILNTPTPLSSLMTIGLLCLVLLIASCEKPTATNADAEKLIIETLENETQYFCERNLEKWQEQWSQKPFVSKMYTGNQPFKEFEGWAAINQNTVDHIKDFPEPIRIPATKQEYTIEVFDKTAFVFYSHIRENKLIRETRFMVKEGGKWKIARMQTIY